MLRKRLHSYRSGPPAADISSHILKIEVGTYTCFFEARVRLAMVAADILIRKRAGDAIVTGVVV